MQPWHRMDVSKVAWFARHEWENDINSTHKLLLIPTYDVHGVVHSARCLNDEWHSHVIKICHRRSGGYITFVCLRQCPFHMCNWTRSSSSSSRNGIGEENVSRPVRGDRVSTKEMEAKCSVGSHMKSATIMSMIFHLTSDSALNGEPQWHARESQKYIFTLSLGTGVSFRSFPFSKYVTIWSHELVNTSFWKTQRLPSQ